MKVVLWCSLVTCSMSLLQYHIRACCRLTAGDWPEHSTVCPHNTAFNTQDQLHSLTLKMIFF